MNHHSRPGLLIVASGQIRQPSARLLEFLDARWRPGPGGLAGILTSMGSPEALKLIEKRFHWPDYSHSEKTAWFKGSLISARDQPEVLAMYKRILSTDIADSELRNWIVLSLFDYQPEKWYGEATWKFWPKPPDRRVAATEVLKELLAVADSLKLDLQVDTRESVRDAKKEIEEILEFRRAGHPERIETLIGELGSDDFKTRDQATRALDKYGDWAAPALRRALESEKRLEPRQRLEGALKKVDRIIIEELTGRLVKIEGLKIFFRSWDKDAKKHQAARSYELAKNYEVNETKPHPDGSFSGNTLPGGLKAAALKNLDEENGVFAYIWLRNDKVTRISVWFKDKQPKE